MATSGDDALVLEQGTRLVYVCLNRPAALNALSGPMIKGLRKVLQDAGERTILVRGQGRAFCAGGDIKMQARSILAGDKATPSAYFKDEYGLNAALFARKFPYVSFLDGIVMGGGYGISAHGSHLVTTDATRFAMPEVGIGFFPDVGAAYHLARVPSEMGTYMALTGNAVGAADMHYMGLAHAHMDSGDFEKLKSALASSSPDEALAGLNKTPAAGSILRQNEAVIARCFAHERVEDVLDDLKSGGGPFALETAATIESRSPTSLKVALAHLRRAKNDDFATVIARDLRLAMAFLNQPDFPEGVRAAVIDKDRQPRWNPPVLAGVGDPTVALYLG